MLVNSLFESLCKFFKVQRWHNFPSTFPVWADLDQIGLAYSVVVVVVGVFGLSPHLLCANFLAATFWLVFPHWYFSVLSNTTPIQVGLGVCSSRVPFQETRSLLPV